MADGTLKSEVETRPLPTPEEFLRFLVEHGNPREGGHYVAQLVRTYARTWAAIEGVPPGKAERDADALFHAETNTADELQAEAS